MRLPICIMHRKSVGIWKEVTSCLIFIRKLFVKVSGLFRLETIGLLCLYDTDYINIDKSIVISITFIHYLLRVLAVLQ